MQQQLDDLAIDWTSPADPRLVQYLGRVEREGATEAVIQSGPRRVQMPHDQVFWLGSVCGPDRGLCRLVTQVGHA
jgi:hypothetical protein